jgi:uncharacterized protein with FMN-binding domain
MKKTLIVIIAIGLLGSLALTHSPKKGSAGGSAPTDVSQSSTSSQATSTSASLVKTYKDGTYTGASEDTPYGTVQIEAIIQGGKITDIKFLQMPFDLGHSREVTAMSEPMLKDMAISRQTAQIDFVTGATDTSAGFESSLQAALDQAAS